MQFLLLKIASLLGMGLVATRADAAGVDRVAIIRTSFAVAAILAFFGAVITGSPHISRPSALLAIVLGIAFVLMFFFWVKSSRTAGTGMAIVALETAIAIPMLASVVFWHERLTWMEITQSVIALIAFGLLISEVVSKVQTNPASPGWFWLAGLFTISGLVNTGAKLFQEKMVPQEIMPFLALLFISGFVVTTLLYYRRKSRVSRPALTYGAALGATNIGYYLFLILGLTILPGTVVYPVTAAGEIGLITLVGFAIQRKKLRFRGWLGIGLAVLALVLV